MSQYSRLLHKLTETSFTKPIWWVPIHNFDLVGIRFVASIKSCILWFSHKWYLDHTQWIILTSLVYRLASICSQPLQLWLSSVVHIYRKFSTYNNIPQCFVVISMKAVNKDQHPEHDLYSKHWRWTRCDHAMRISDQWPFIYISFMQGSCKCTSRLSRRRYTRSLLIATSISCLCNRKTLLQSIVVTWKESRIGPANYIPRENHKSCARGKNTKQTNLTQLTKSCRMSEKSLPYFSSASSKRLASDGDQSSISSLQSTGPPLGTRHSIALDKSYLFLCKVSIACNCTKSVVVIPQRQSKIRKQES